MKITNLNELRNFAREVTQGFGAEFKAPFVFGIARLTRGANQSVLKADFAVVNSAGEADATAAVLLYAIAKNGAKIKFDSSEFRANFGRKEVADALEIFDFLLDEAVGEAHKNLQVLMAVSNALDDEFSQEEDADGLFEAVFLWEDAKPLSVEAVYAKLYLLSTQKAAIRSLNLDGAFGLMPNLAWDYFGECFELDFLRENEIALKMNGTYPAIAYVDKFPRYLSCVVPPQNVRILDSAKVRMGAHLGVGTTVMPGAAYINFNAGTNGAVMVEGRVSSSVSVGEGSDVGGGASILGVLSGTNGNPITIGKRCLLGANSVTGVPLGDDCIVDAGIAILEGTKVFLSKAEGEKLSAVNPQFAFDKEIYKALDLAGLNGLHYRQNSQTGQISVSLSKRAIKLNSQLH